MITRAKENTTPTTTYNGASLGSTIRQNIVEKLPVINTQVNFRNESNEKNKEILFFLRQLHLLI